MSAPRVETAAGIVTGLHDRGVSVFLGIPYGESTSGARRFLPPSARRAWTGELDCVRFGPSSPPTLAADDRAFFPVSPLWSVYAGRSADIPFSEDCLRLNVWTASTTPDRPKPVMVWMHGGGFSWGSGSSPLTVGDALARDHDVVVVTVNHRLGVLGYLYGDDQSGFEDSGVAGLLDLRLALEWVRDNIAAFGGDPSNVTIAGHSGGSAKVACLLALPSARGLFQRAIIMSGVVTLRSMTVPEARDETAQLLERARLGAGETARLRDIDVHGLTMLASGLRFRPVVGEPALPAHPFDPVAASSASGIPVLAGVAKDDAATFKYDSDPTFHDMDDADLRRRVAGLPLVRDAAHADALIREFTDRFPELPPQRILVEITTQGLRNRTALTLARKLEQSDAAVWAYEFAYDIVMPADTPFPGERMAPHGGELPFVFDIADREWLAGDAEDRVEFAHRVSTYWTNFVKSGDPNDGTLPAWPAYRPGDPGTIMWLD